MREFFSGWRRKIGVVTLVMACVFMAAWVRSRFKIDDLEIPLGDGTYAYGVKSMSGGIDFYRVAGMVAAGEWIYSSHLAPSDERGNPIDVTPWPAHEEIEWRRDWAGFHFGASRWKNKSCRIEDCMIPYWSIVIPLTAISAFLLLKRVD